MRSDAQGPQFWLWRNILVPSTANRNVDEVVGTLFCHWDGLISVECVLNITAGGVGIRVPLLGEKGFWSISGVRLLFKC